MGGACVFRAALVRKPLKRWNAYKRASGPHKGISTENVPWEIYVVCSNGHGLDAHTYHLLRTSIDMVGLVDLLEMHEVHTSWKHAEMLNARWRKDNNIDV